MRPLESSDTTPKAGWSAMRRFLPYLWPAGEPRLKARVVIAFLLVLLAKGVSLSTGFVYKGAIDIMSGSARGADAAAGLAVGLVLAYAGARFAGVLFENLRNAIFERVGQDAARRLAEKVFAHIHRLSLRFHLERRTGALTKIVERGTKSIDMMLYFLLFNIAPTVVELAVICVIFGVKFGTGLVVATLVMVVAYIAFTRFVTEWRTKLQRQMNEVDNQAIGRAVDSLLNYETVKYFGAEARETQRYGGAMRAFADAAVKNETSLAWLNVGQSLITNLMMAGAMGYTVWGWSRGQFTTGDVVLVNTLLAQLFRPLDMLGWVYRTIRQGLIDMEAMFGLIDTPAEVKDAPGAPDLRLSQGRVRFEDVRFGYDPEREILPRDRPRRRSGNGDGGGRAVGRRQVDPVATPLPLLRADRRADHDRRPGYLQGHPGEPSLRDRNRPAGHGAVQRFDRLQYRLRPRRRDPGGDRGGGARGASIHDFILEPARRL